MRRLLLFFTPLLLIAIVAAAGFLGWRTSQANAAPTPQAPPTVPVTTCDIQQTVTAPGSLVNTRYEVLEMPAAGSLAEVRVRAGDRVQAGQVLAALDGQEEFAAQAAAAELELLKAQDALAQVHAGAPAERAAAQVALAEAEERLVEAQKDRQRMDYPRYNDNLVVENARVDYALAKDVYKDALREYGKVDQKRQTNPERVLALKRLLEAKQKVDQAFARLNWYLLMPGQEDKAQADAELALAQAELEQARLTWERLADGPDSLKLALAEAQVASAEAVLESARQVLESLELRAPFDGVVIDVQASPGQPLGADAPVLTLSDPSALEVEATVIEEDLPLIRPGQSVEVFFDALPESQATGQLARIVPQRLQGDRPLYPIYITLDEVDSALVAGMTTDASIIIASAEGATCLPRAVVRASSGDTAVVSVWADGVEEKRTVQVGLRGDLYIEILSGLQPGELVVSQ